jgi:glucose/arabinose dehydrogenase
MKHIALLTGAVVIIVCTLVYVYREEIMGQLFEPTGSLIPTGEVNGEAAPPEVIAENLTIPWEVVFAPHGMFVTERPGTVSVFVEGQQRRIPIVGSEPRHTGEGGLLGMAFHPDFVENRFVYLYMTTEAPGGGLSNEVVRYTLGEGGLINATPIVGNIPGASYHDGGRIAFGPDGLLYVTTGDAGREALAQNTESLAGKILRVRDDGSIPTDNPFGNAVYSYGHRNVQGIAWDDSGQLWATEHGRSGASSGYDELNKIERGGNYGWPEIQGDETAPGMKTPVLHSGPSETWAPAGMAYLRGHLVFAGLRGESLYVVDIADGEAQGITAYLRGEYGRLRTVAVGPDDFLYVLTSNRDGRGEANEDDDKIIRIDPALFK